MELNFSQAKPFRFLTIALSQLIIVGELGR